MKIDLINKHTEHIETVVDLINDEFGTENSREFYKDIINHSLNEDELPITFVLTKDNDLVGTVGIWRGDLLSRQDLYPWLSALVVKEEFRNKGIGIKLQEYILNYCALKNYKEIYLYTDIENYYEKTGWKCIDIGYEYSGNKVNIYRYDLE